MNPIDPNAPAYPFTLTEIQPIALEDLDRENVIPEIKHTHFPGIPIRLEIASRVMAGMMASSIHGNDSDEDMAASALSAADALIAAHNASVKCPQR